MGKEKPTDKPERRAEKAAKKEKRSDKDGVHKSTKPKKEKKPLTPTSDPDTNIAAPLLETLSSSTTATAVKVDPDAAAKPAKSAPLIGALVPFANPLADEKAGKKVLKSVKKAAKNKSLKRGVKEVVKALRKSAPATASASGGSSNTGTPAGVVVLAADISPMDVISHIPVLCEDHGIPYIFVPSRAELGAAGSTKRPTSVVMVGPEKGGKKGAGEKAEGEAEEDFAEVYAELVRVVGKAARDVRV
ncbi:snoRNA-binding protein [Xylographa carneopallida]|nr:snoRNA-binding protein [Xylographa carneopallida]